MTVHQCPKCELRFTWITELDEHCRTEHPRFRHEYPASKPSHPADVDVDGGEQRTGCAPASSG